MNKQQFTDSVFLSLDVVLHLIDKQAYDIVNRHIDASICQHIDDSHYQTIYWCCEAIEEAVDKFPSRWKNKTILRQLI